MKEEKRLARESRNTKAHTSGTVTPASRYWRAPTASPVAMARKMKPMSRDWPTLRRKRMIENAANMPKAVARLPMTTRITSVTTVPRMSRVWT